MEPELKRGLVVAVVQARLSSTRFPRKVLGELSKGHSVISSLHYRLMRSTRVDRIVYAIPNSSSNDDLEEYLSQLGAFVLRGSETDVQSRFLEAAETFDAKTLVRITGDCPLIDPAVVDSVIEKFFDEHVDYCSNVDPPTFPDGIDVEVFSVESLLNSRKLSSSVEDKEHVTSSLRGSGLFKTANFQNSEDFSSLRWTIDYPDDLDSLSSLLPADFIDMDFSTLVRLGVGIRDPKRQRNEGMFLNEGQKLWSRAKGVIPGGSMLLSKRAEMFLPEQWPAYYSKAKGIRVWDLEGEEYLDFATMSVGTCSLGYGVDRIDKAVKSAIDAGVMSTLNSPGEVELAEKLISLHPWAGMARFARSGGEANAIAVRIARAFTKKDKVAVCGYHGWHDWYLAANLGADSNLDGHLLPGLEPTGVPRSLMGTTVPFDYNDAEALEKLLKSGDFAAVKMEVSRSFGPDHGFLERVRELCSFHGVVLIFDECTSGFRETFGGLHLKYGVEPDLAMFGKALGNGYAITSVIGRKEVMQSAQTSFISSTFWTERLGPVAALATLAEMECQKSWEVIPEAGRKVKEIWSQSFGAQGVDVSIGGLDALPTFAIETKHWPVLRTLFIQELLRRGFLATSGFYSSTAHDPSSLERYADAVSEVAEIIAKNFSEERALGLLEGPVAQTGFKRLN